MGPFSRTPPLRRAVSDLGLSSKSLKIRDFDYAKMTWIRALAGPSLHATAAGLKCRRARRAAPARAQSQAGAHAELRWHARRATPARAQSHTRTHAEPTSRLHAQRATPARAQTCSCTSNRAVHQHTIIHQQIEEISELA